MKNILLGLALPLALLIGGVGLYVLIPAPLPPQRTLPDPTNVAELLEYVPEAEVAEVYALRQHSETLQVRANGTVVPYRELNIAAEVAGRIVEKNPQARSGNFIREGELLFRIDPSDYELEVERLTQQKQQALASIDELEQDVISAEELLAVAEEQLKIATADVQRLEGLSANLASASEFDDARQGRLTSMNSVVTQKNQIRTLKTRRNRLELAANLAQTQLEQAQLNLSRCEVRATTDGRIVQDEVEVDSFVQRGTMLMSIEDTEKVEISCNLRMDQLFWVLDQPSISADQLVSAAQASRHELPESEVQVNFRVAGREDVFYRWTGMLDRFEGNGLDPQSRTVPIRIRVDKPSDFQVVSISDSGKEQTSSEAKADRRGPPMLVRGMYVDVDILAKPSTPLLLVPKLSIKPASPTAVLWKFDRDREAVFKTEIAQLAINAAKDAESDAESKKRGNEARPGTSSRKQAEGEGSKSVADLPKPEEWNIGFLDVVDGVQMIRAYWGELPDAPQGIEYWVCEVPRDVSPGDMVITTPLPGIKADGTDPVRFPMKDLDAKNENENVDSDLEAEPIADAEAPQVGDQSNTRDDTSKVLVEQSDTSVRSQS